MRIKFGGLWKNRDFRNLWLGQTASMMGSNITSVLLPLIAALTLSASVFELGLLTAAGYAPYLLVSLFAGVWLDRKPKRLIIVFADLLRGLALVGVAVGIWTDQLTVPLLLAMSFTIGSCSVISDIGGMSYLPALVRRDQLIGGNSKLELSSSVSNVSGSAIGGAIFQALTAASAVMINAVAYFLSTVFTALIGNKGENTEEPEKEQQSIWKDIGEGLQFVVGHPAIRVMVIATLVSNFCALALEPLFLVFVSRELGLSPFAIGLIFSSAGAGALIGAVIAGPLNRRFGVGPVIVLTTATAGVASILTPVATLLSTPVAIAMLVTMHVVDAAMVIACNINLRSYRAAVTPDALQGRMNASIRMVVMGIAPLGAIFGGLLGSYLNITASLVLVSSGVILAAVIVACSPIRKVRDIASLSNEPELTDDQQDPKEDEPVR